MKAAGLPLTGYETFLDRLSEQIPVITGNMAVDSSGVFHARGDKALADQLRQYSILEYNDIADAKNRISGFFDQ